MFAVDHAATALLIKRRYPSVSLTPILVSVQAMELAWVGLNYLGIERTTTEATVHSVADIEAASASSRSSASATSRTSRSFRPPFPVPRSTWPAARYSS